MYLNTSKNHYQHHVHIFSFTWLSNPASGKLVFVFITINVFMMIKNKLLIRHLSSLYGSNLNYVNFNIIIV